jgi:hypothetical protein
MIVCRTDHGSGRNKTASNLESAGYGVPCSDRSSSGVQEEPCYVSLGMREPGDKRLASVYKPEQRKMLQVTHLICHAKC